MSMKTKSPPSRYRYCISRRSTLATSTLTPALKVRSTTLPDMMFFSLVRTKAPPLPGLTCWNSTTVQSCPSRLSAMPFFKSFVVATFSLSRSKNEKFSRCSREEARPVGPHDQDVLYPDTTPVRQVDTWLDGDQNPACEFTRSAVPDGRRLVHLEPDAVPQSVLEVVAVPGVPDQVAGGRVHVPDVGARPGGVQTGSLRGRDQLVDLPLPAGRLAQCDGTGHVGVVAAVQRAEVHRDQVAAAQWPVGRRVVRDRAVRAAGHDGVEGGPLGAQRDHPGVQRRRQPAFGHTGYDQREHVGDGLAGDPAGGPEQLDLGRILDRPQFLDLPAERDDFHAPGSGHEFGVAFDRHLVCLERHRAQGPAGHFRG